MMKAEAKNILVVGAGKAGKLLARDIASRYPEHQVIGFVDDQASRNKQLLGSIDDMPRLVRIYKVSEIIIAIPSADGSLMRRILLKNAKNRIPIRMVPRELDVISESKVLYDETKSVSVEDFLGRAFYKKNVERLKEFYRGKTVFVTGGAGSIGSEIVRQLIDLKARVVVYDNSEYLVFMLEQQLREEGNLENCKLIVGSILHDNKLNVLFKRIRPDIVFHVAAYKHVHLMQDNVDEAIYNNVIGTKRVIEAALNNGVKLFTFVSTDKVVNPTSVMGATKKLCEYYIQCLKPRGMDFNIVRFGNVINSHGSVLPLFERQIEKYRYVTITHRKMERFFMSIREAASLVIESTALGKRNGIHILNMGELIRIYDVAQSLIRSKNLVPNEDVEVRITGLRKGEKMIEELYTDKERANMVHTKIDKVFTLKNAERCPVDISRTIDELEELVKRGDARHATLQKKLKAIFPSLKMP